MDKPYEINARAIIDTVLIQHDSINTKGVGLEVDTVVHKTEWQIAIEQRLDSLSTANNTLSAQVTQLQRELAMQSEVCRQRR